MTPIQQVESLIDGSYLRAVGGVLFKKAQMFHNPQ